MTQYLLELFVHVIELCAMHLACSSTRLGLHKRNRPPFWEITAKLQEDKFRLCFRMSREAFFHLVNSVLGELQKDVKMGSLRNGAIEPEVRLAVVLRILQMYRTLK